MPPTTAPSPAWRWDLFCRVVDNFGDIGVCWRLAADLADRGHAVRLWVDDASALAWMAPHGHADVTVRAWPGEDARFDGDDAPGDVVVEAFGCDPPPAFVAAMAARAEAGAAPPAWINLEYLSAEPYVERSHGLRSPQMSGPGRGLDKWFFYPGFTAATGGLLRERGLADAQAAFDRDAWCGAHGLRTAPGERLASVFCYPDSDLPGLVDALHRGGQAWCVATAPGAATALAQRLAPHERRDGVRLVGLPWLAQAGYDRLLWACDLNLVRGEDSFTRAQWAGRPFVWQPYRQDDGVHADKLEAFLALLRPGADLAADDPAWRHWAAWHRAWGGPAAGAAASAAPLPAWTPALLTAVSQAALRWRAHLLGSADLTARLLAFVGERR
jgi:uncharacterized repeat protein (TIGR03837 family)